MLLAARVAYMMGRKLEEADWAHVYTNSRGIPQQGWSNLSADVQVPGLSVEHKMMKVSETQPIKSLCGTTQMHPALTRRVSLPNIEDPMEAMREVIKGYQKVLDDRQAAVQKITPTGKAELRSGWLIYETSLTEFLYFEEEMTNLNPKTHKAEWREGPARGEGGRRANRNLWVYSKETNQKVWSVTGGSSGTKIQPYFTIPAAYDSNLYYFRVQGESTEQGMIRVWITEPTASNLEKVLGKLGNREVTKAINDATVSIKHTEDRSVIERVRELVIQEDSYKQLKDKFPGESDEHSFQLLYENLTRK